jgi:UDP-N-acetylmuramoyl-tripeptide--D-alanyl-D-alanine ligase
VFEELIRFTAREVEVVCRGRLVRGRGDVAVTSAVTDSREATPGAVFFALKGERVDGHDFVGDAVNRGATAVVVSRPVESPLPESTAVVMVDNTTVALGLLAAEHRRRFAGMVVGVTGSVGKTSTKEMTASVLSVRLRVLKNPGNMNTEIGVPLAAFNLSPAFDAAVFELAMRSRGEIAWLASIVKPSVGVITNIGETHLERLGTRENIAAAKAELLEELPPDGLAVLNGDNEWARKVRERARCRAVFYGMETPADVCADEVRVRPEGTDFRLRASGGSTRCTIAAPGEHHVYNAMAAACVGLWFGLSLDEIAAGLRAFRPAGMRTEFLRVSGVTVINDAYNASPVSTKAALAVLSRVSQGRKVAVLGNMLELGDYSVEGHRETGKAACAAGVDELITVGDLAVGIADGALGSGMDPARVHNCSSNQEALSLLRVVLREGDTVLVKGSRGARMEEIVNGLMEGGTCGTS